MGVSSPSDFRPAVSHGGNLDLARERFGEPAGGWLDLSTGISPWPYRFTPLSPESWARLPAESALDALRAVAARRYGAPDAACVTALPGTQAFLQLLPRLRPPEPVAVVSPTYGEHVATWAAAGHPVAEVATPEAAERAAAIVVLTNPNNPDGRIVAPDRLVPLAARLATRGGLLVVDEAFADVAPGVSLAPRCDHPAIVVLRSFGKLHGLAGVRLGFALTAPVMARAFEAALGPWAVSGPALAIGREALADDAWQAEIRVRLAAMAARLDAVLQATGLPVVGGTSLFRLVETPDAGPIFERLGRTGILVRQFPTQPNRLRFGLPPDEAGLRRLAAALAD